MATALAPPSAHGSFLAAASLVKPTKAHVRAAAPTHQTVAPLPPLPSVPLIQRLGFYVTSNPGQVAGFVPHFVQVNQGNLQAVEARLRNPNAHVYVLVHGYAPGFEDWVRNYAFGTGKLKGTGKILDWWQTIPSNYFGGKSNPTYKFIQSFDPNKVGAESPWLLDGYTTPGSGPGSDLLVSANGLAPDLVASDPNAVVLAYSWLDDSATSTKTITIPIAGYSFSIPQDAYKSEARTAMNGERLAMALQQVLGTHFQGKLQLIGHSHGSKVATVAAVALTRAANPITPTQLTILDSPESDAGTTGYTGALLAEIGATNDNWIFLNDLAISKVPSSNSTFVDNYISALDEPFTEITYPGSSKGLANVVDVNLYDFPDLVHNPLNVHSYAAFWYAGSSEGTATTKGYSTGRKWSPLLPGNTGPNMPPRNLPSNYYTQSQFWPIEDSQYFVRPVLFPSSIDPKFDPVSLTATSSSPRVQATTVDSVTLTQQKSTSQTFTGSFTTARQWSAGLTFNYQFTHLAKGDMLNIYDKTPNGQWQLAFVMDPNAVLSQTKPLQGTISLGSFSIATYDLKFTLTSTTRNSTSSVKIDNIMQYANPSTIPVAVV
jgi:hypothetical protein